MRVSETGERIGVKMAKQDAVALAGTPMCKKLMDA